MDDSNKSIKCEVESCKLTATCDNGYARKK